MGGAHCGGKKRGMGNAICSPEHAQKEVSLSHSHRGRGRFTRRLTRSKQACHGQRPKHSPLRPMKYSGASGGLRALPACSSVTLQAAVKVLLTVGRHTSREARVEKRAAEAKTGHRTPKAALSQSRFLWLRAGPALASQGGPAWYPRVTMETGMPRVDTCRG